MALLQFLDTRLEAVSPCNDAEVTIAFKAVDVFGRAFWVLGLPGPTCPYQLRHGGTNKDIRRRLRSAEEVKAKGPSRSESSVRRYVRPAQMQTLLIPLPLRTMSFGSSSLAVFSQLLAGLTPHRVPPLLTNALSSPSVRTKA